jgi:TatD DNase family protein
MKYVDIHCHLDLKDFDNDREAVLARMKEERIGAITIGADLESSKRAVEIAEANENIWACIGVHPNIISQPPLNLRGGERSEGVILELEELVKSPKVVGIGECGLDYFRLENESDKISQKNLFEFQIQFALKYDKPLMLHVRDAYNDVINILENYKNDPSADGSEKLRGNVHFFAADLVVAKRFLDLGFTMSFTGVITFTHDYDEVIKYIPQNSIMSETDAPWVAPVPFRGKRNESVYVIEVVKKMAEIRGENLDVLNNIIIENFGRVFLRTRK